MKILRAYVRKSEYEQDSSDRFTRDRQRDSIEAWERLHGPFDIAWYEDLDISGLFEAKRPGWRRLVSDLNPQTDHGVIVEDYDRSHRNVREALAFYDDILAPMGLKYISTLHNLDLSTADGRAWFIDRMKYAEWEARKASERMKRTVEYKVHKLGRHWGRTPFGCDRDDITKHLIPTTGCYWYNPTTGQAINPDDDSIPNGWEVRYYFDALRGLYDIYSVGHRSLSDTALMVNEIGWRRPGPGGKPKKFDRIIVYRLLHNWRVYAGEMIVDGEVARAGHEPILPVELCYQIGGILKRRNIVRTPDREITVYLLSSVLYCAGCQMTMTGQTMRRKYSYYRHSDTKIGDCPEAMVRCEGIDRQITELLLDLLNLKQVIKSVSDKVIRALQMAAMGEEMACKLQDKQKERSRLIDLHVSGLISKQDFISRLKPIEAEIEQMEGKTAFLGDFGNLAQLTERIMADLSLFSQASIYDKRMIVRKLFEKILIENKKIVGIIPARDAMPLFVLLRRALPLLQYKQSPTYLALELIELPTEYTDTMAAITAV